MLFCLLVCSLSFLELCPMVFSSITVNNFHRVQSDTISSSECSIDEFHVENSSTSAKLQCGLQCSSSERCIGMEIIGKERCRILSCMCTAFEPSNETSKQVIRYQKLTGIEKAGWGSFCKIQLTNGQQVSTLCYQGTNLWLLIQRRLDGSVNFTRHWTDYENGFGCLESEFWLGNRNIHELTDDGYQYLRIEMMDHDGVWKYAEYSTFHVESASLKYKLHIDGYSGDADDSLLYHDEMFFSTFDNDNDNYTENCAQLRRGGWWYKYCHKANLNGEYGNAEFSNGINWNSWRGFYYSMKEVRMMVRKNGIY